MDLEMVFNELSLRVLADNIQTAQQRMSDLVATARQAAELGVKPIIRTHSQFYADLLAQNYSLSDWLVDRNVNKDIQRFILTTAKAPFLEDIQNSEIENKNSLSEFYYEGKLTEGLGIAYLLETLAISLISEKCWNCSCLELEVRQIDENEKISTVTTEIIHASCEAHIQEHTNWIQNRICTGVKDGIELWNRKGELFPNLEFCESVKKQLENIRTRQLELQPVIKALFELQNCSKNWNNGAFSTQGYSIETSGESEPTLNQYSKQRTFRCPDGEERLFEQHVKLRVCNWRIHFLPENPNKAIIVGYIGRHLPTDKYK
jgi:hypothetical protein